VVVRGMVVVMIMIVTRCVVMLMVVVVFVLHKIRLSLVEKALSPIVPQNSPAGATSRPTWGIEKGRARFRARAHPQILRKKY
jgi:hypothetical protein